MASEGLNKVMLIGHVGGAPELKHTQSGKSVLRMRLATGKSWKDQSGEKQERTEWHTVIVWGKRADALSRYINSGDKLYIEGELRTREWETNEGAKRSTTEVVIGMRGELKFLGGGKVGKHESHSGSGIPRGDTRGGGGGGSVPVGQGGDFGDDDIPF